jgi:hypothetical protein
MTDRNGLSLLRPYMVFWTDKYDHLVNLWRTHKERRVKENDCIIAHWNFTSICHVWRLLPNSGEVQYTGSTMNYFSYYYYITATLFHSKWRQFAIFSWKITRFWSWIWGVTFKFSFRSHWGRERRCWSFFLHFSVRKYQIKHAPLLFRTQGFVMTTIQLSWSYLWTKIFVSQHQYDESDEKRTSVLVKFFWGPRKALPVS